MTIRMMAGTSTKPMGTVTSTRSVCSGSVEHYGGGVTKAG